MGTAAARGARDPRWRGSESRAHHADSDAPLPYERAEWVSGNRSSLVKWANHVTGTSVFHEIELQNPQANVEINHQAQDGKAYFAMASVRVPFFRI